MEQPLNVGYEQRIGRYSRPLAAAFVMVLDLRGTEAVLDVGCGSGALTERIAAEVGTHRVFGVDPSAEDLQTCAQRVPGADLRVGSVEQLPFGDATMDAVAAQLVVGLLPDAPAGVREMCRVSRPDGVVAGCVWDFGGEMTVLRTFWDAAGEVVASATEHDQARTQHYTTPSELTDLWTAAGLVRVTSGELVVESTYRDVDDLWLPLAAPGGAPGDFLALLDPEQQGSVRRRMLERLGDPSGPFSLTARAWSVKGYAP